MTIETTPVVIPAPFSSRYSHPQAYGFCMIEGSRPFEADAECTLIKHTDGMVRKALENRLLLNPPTAQGAKPTFTAIGAETLNHVHATVAEAAIDNGRVILTIDPTKPASDAQSLAVRLLTIAGMAKIERDGDDFIMVITRATLAHFAPKSDDQEGAQDA